MIDEEKTFADKGYRSTELKPYSKKKVWAICEGEDCQREGGRGRWVMFCSYRTLCYSCAIKYLHLIKGGDTNVKRDCIDDDITYAKKGYRSTELKPGSHKEVWAICANPDCEREGGRGRWVEFCHFSDLCNLCAHKTDEIREKIGDAHRNKIVLDETKKLISENHADVSGENNGNWKGGITPENHLFRNSVKYVDWRKSVFKRDDYTCQECGQRGGDLEAHHILPYNDYRDAEYSLNVDNGITLCVRCHNKTKGREYEFVDRYQKIINDNR